MQSTITPPLNTALITNKELIKFYLTLCQQKLNIIQIQEYLLQGYTIRFFLLPTEDILTNYSIKGTGVTTIILMLASVHLDMTVISQLNELKPLVIICGNLKCPL